MTTSKVTKAVSTALMAVAAIGASAGAFAVNNPLGPTDLLVAVWNPVSSASYVEDLGSIGAGSPTDLSTTFDNAGYSTSWTLDGGVGNLATTLGTGLVYQVFAVGAPSSSTIKNNYAYLSQQAGTTISTGFYQTQLVNNAEYAISNYLAAYLPGTTNSFVGSSTGPGGNSWIASSVTSPGYDFQVSVLAGISSAAVGSGLNLIDWLNTTNQSLGFARGTAVGSPGNTGLFVLAANGVLNYYANGTATSPVPLPPAGWLLISGLLGLLAVGRRRGAEAS